MIRMFMTWLYGIKSDKWLHAIVALVIVEALFLAVFRCMGKPVGLLLSTAVTLAVCALKELLDMASRKGVASWGDFVAGIVGTVVGLSVMILT